MRDECKCCGMPLRPGCGQIGNAQDGEYNGQLLCNECVEVIRYGYHEIQDEDY